MKGRDDSYRNVCTSFEQRRLSRAAAPSDKQINHLTALHCAPGGGKSFFLDELAKLNSNDLRNYCGSQEMCHILQTSTAVCVTFNKMSNVRSLELGSAQVAVQGFSIRALWSYFVQAEDEQGKSTFEGFGNFLEKRLSKPLSLLNAVTCIIGHSQDHGVLLLVDEIIKAYYVDDIVSEIGTCLDELPPNFFNAVVSTLDVHAVQKTSSNRPIKWISLPPLNNEDGFALFKELLNKIPPSRQKVIKQLIADCSGHPR